MEHSDLYVRACAAGFIAGTECTPTPMVFGAAKNLTGNEIIPGTEDVCYEGVCGSAWVNIKPANCSFASWAKTYGKAKKSYYSGVDIWCHEFNQSMERKEAWANAFCEVLNENDIRAYPMSRMN